MVRLWLPVFVNCRGPQSFQGSFLDGADHGLLIWSFNSIDFCTQIGDSLMKRFLTAFVVLILLGVFAATTQAVTIETVPVGNLGNTGELSGLSAGGHGPDAIVGAVDYAYNIGKYEVTAGQYCEFLNAVANKNVYGLYDSYMLGSYGCKIRQIGTFGNFQYLVDADGDGIEDADWINRPVNSVSWGDAARFCNWLDNGQPTGTLTGDPEQDAGLTEDGAYDLNGATSMDLEAVSRRNDATWVIPTGNEWYKAAYHKNDGNTGNYYDYPTGSDSVPGRDMTEATNPGNNANYNSGSAPIDSPFYRTEVGEFELSDSPYGTFDQGGNLGEWNETPGTGSRRGVRGAFWGEGSDGLSASYYGNVLQWFAFSSLGFRVASVPEPGTITLLLCGLVSVALIRRR